MYLLRLVQDIWDSITEVPEEVLLSDAQKKELDTRADRMRAHPEGGVLWEEIRANLRL